MWSAARALASHAEVSILTSASWRGRYEELAGPGDERLLPGVRFAFVEEPSGDLSPFLSWNHLWSLRLLEGVARLHPDGGPDVLELPDYQAEGFASVHARRGLDPRLGRTALAVGLHTSAEMCAVLDGEPATDHLRTLAGLERFTLRFADALLWPGGKTLERYGEFYGGESLAPAIRRPLPAPADLPSPAPLVDSPEAGPVRLLYLNRLQRLKGIEELVTAIRSLPDEDLTLTVVGGDTATGPEQTSMRAHIQSLVADDHRIVVRGQVPHDDVAGLIAQHHAVVVPSHWEAYGYVVREALGSNRPVIATPVGWIPEAVRAGESGWLARSSAPEDLAAALRDVLDARATLTAMVADGRPRAVYDGLPSEDATCDAYLELLDRSAETAPATAPTAKERQRVAALIACEAGGGDPVSTLVSLEGQHDASVRSILVVGPSGVFPGPGGGLARADAVVATAGNRRDAWRAALAHISEELVLLAPAGAVLEHGFLRRAASALAGEPGLAWVTAFAATGGRPEHAPPGSYRLPLAELGASPSVALIRTTALEAALSDEDGAADAEPDLFVRLARADAHGLVLQEPLLENLPRRAAPQPVAQR